LLSRRHFLARAATIAGGASLLAGARAIAAEPEKPFAITVYKSPSCGCCTKWVDILKANKALRVSTRDVDDVGPLKESVGVPAALASCHTAVANGYAFEGHVPVDLVLKVLRERPKIAGLAVPGMPAGSPGMEVPGRKDAYDVVAFTRDGKTRVFAKR
jgi:hypothetical protein